jgi:phenylalanyl-tRNA synthetase alpha chain
MSISLSQIETELTTLQQEATVAIAATDNLTDLENLRVAYLGKKDK